MSKLHCLHCLIIIINYSDSSEQEMTYVSKCIKYQSEDLDKQIKNKTEKHKQFIKSNAIKEIELQQIRLVKKSFSCFYRNVYKSCQGLCIFFQI